MGRMSEQDAVDTLKRVRRAIGEAFEDAGAALDGVPRTEKQAAKMEAEYGVRLRRALDKDLGRELQEAIDSLKKAED